MEHAKKFVLLPQENVEKFQALHNHTKNTVQTPGNELTRLDHEMSNVLNSAQVNDSEKWKSFEQLLIRFLNAAENLRPPGEIKESKPIPEKVDQDKPLPLEEGTVIATIPKRYEKNAIAVLQNIQQYPDKISWDDKGTVTIDGVELAGSNIVDLMNDAMRERKTESIPRGSIQFAKALRQIAINKKYIGNDRFWRSGNTSSGHAITTPATEAELTGDDGDDDDDESENRETIEPKPSGVVKTLKNWVNY